MAQNSSNTSKKKREVLEEIKVLSYGVFGLQNRIFGKFFVSFHLTTFGNTSNVDEILGNSYISVRQTLFVHYIEKFTISNVIRIHT